jgi:LacI family transcriptional regulator
VRQPLREMGEAAARMLISHFGETSLADVPTVIPTTLVIRGSTASAVK